MLLQEFVKQRSHNDAKQQDGTAITNSSEDNEIEKMMKDVEEEKQHAVVLLKAQIADLERQRSNDLDQLTQAMTQIGVFKDKMREEVERQAILGGEINELKGQ